MLEFIDMEEKIIGEKNKIEYGEGNATILLKELQ